MGTGWNSTPRIPRGLGTFLFDPHYPHFWGFRVLLLVSQWIAHGDLYPHLSPFCPHFVPMGSVFGDGGGEWEQRGHGLGGGYFWTGLTGFSGLTGLLREVVLVSGRGGGQGLALVFLDRIDGISGSTGLLVEGGWTEGLVGFF